jgi:hypothetical protein
LIYVSDTATGYVADLAEQAINALRQLNRLTATARVAGAKRFVPPDTAVAFEAVD